MNPRNWPCHRNDEHLHSLPTIREILNRFRRRPKPFQIDEHTAAITDDWQDRIHWMEYRRRVMEPTDD